jgi:hypothetical protein
MRVESRKERLGRIDVMNHSSDSDQVLFVFTCQARLFVFELAEKV